MNTHLRTSEATAKSLSAEDGTTQLLRWGGWMVGTGVLAAALLETVLGGFSRTGASTNGGWFALIVALMCVPFGSLLLLLGMAKWLRNRRLSRSPELPGPGAHSK